MHPEKLLTCLSLVAGLSSCSRAPKELLPPDAGAAAVPDTGSVPSPESLLAPAGSALPDHHPTEFELGPLAPDAPFAGRLTLQLTRTNPTDSDKTDIVTFYFTVKGKKARWDLFGEAGTGDPSGYRIYDGNQHKFFTVMRQPVLYTTDEATLIATRAADAGAPKNIKLVPDKSEPGGNVQGVACTRMMGQDDEDEYLTCLATGLPPIPLHLLGEASAAILPFGADIEKKGLFPLTVLVRSKERPKGSPIKPILARLSTLKVERGDPPDSAFTPPSYPVTELPFLVAPRLVR